MRVKTVRGDDLKPGDTLKVWWSPGTAQIIEIKQYNGPLATLFPEGARIARFNNHYAMTIGNHEAYEVMRVRNQSERQQAGEISQEDARRLLEAAKALVGVMSGGWFSDGSPRRSFPQLAELEDAIADIQGKA